MLLLISGHDCLRKHLNRFNVISDSLCFLCNHRDDMDRLHIQELMLVISVEVQNRHISGVCKGGRMAISGFDVIRHPRFKITRSIANNLLSASNLSLEKRSSPYHSSLISQKINRCGAAAPQSQSLRLAEVPIITRSFRTDTSTLSLCIPRFPRTV
ncbi:hypothetical protein TNCV_2664801 [Trichonephila clavipes]|nr:hypothetical protein TNCV_2664801 [Trichonephila clavipes]